MQKEEVELINNITDLEQDQRYLLNKPKTPQQSFLHLFGHRHLASKLIFSQHIQDIALGQLPGSFAQQALQLSYQNSCIVSHVQLNEAKWSLFGLVQDWINYYPTIRNHQQVLFCDVISQEHSTNIFRGFGEYVTYVNLIALDLWKILRRGKRESEFGIKRPFKEQVKDIKDSNFMRFEVNDLIAFLQSCLPRTLLNSVLEQDARPFQLRNQRRVECLYADHQAQYHLRSCGKLGLLLKELLLVLMTVELNPSQQAQYLGLIVRYYQVYHPFRGLNANQIFVYGFNTISSQVTQQLKNQLLLFLRVMIKLDKDQLLNFLSNSSDFFKGLIESARKSSIIGMSQQAFSPYHPFELSEKISIPPGKSQCRYIQIIDAWSLLYFRVRIPVQNLTLRLHYLGSIQSNKDSSRVVLNLQRQSGEVKDSVNMVKAGLYMIQFDNSYSWMSGKTVMFEKVVFTPVEVQKRDAYAWNYDFYENLMLNQISNDDKIVWIEDKKPDPKPAQSSGQAQPIKNKQGSADLSRRDDLLTMRMRNKEGLHTYETDNSARMEQVVSQLFKNNSSVKWTINGKVSDMTIQPTNDLGAIEGYLRGGKQQPEPTQATQAVQGQQEQEGSDSFDKEDDDVQYEVVRREKGGAARSDRAQQRKKDQIDCSAEQMAECYD